MSETKKADRLRKARISAGYKSASEAARSLGVSTATYIHHENGTRDFSEGPAAIYARRFHVTQSWLLLGGGEMRDEALEAERSTEIAERQEGVREDQAYRESLGPEERERRRSDEVRLREREALKATQDMALIPEIRPEFSRNMGHVFGSWQRFADLDDLVYHPVAATWGIPNAHLQHELDTPPTAAILFPIIGNANMPSLAHGDLVIVDTSTDDVIADGFYLVADKVSQPQVRFLRVNLFSQPRTVTMFAEATPDEKQALELEALSVVGKVVGKITRI